MSQDVASETPSVVVSWPRHAVRAVAEWLDLAVAVEGPWSVPCRVADPELWWYPATEEAAAAACRTECPAVGECLAYALAADERYGVWGGLSPAERKRLRGGS